MSKRMDLAAGDSLWVQPQRNRHAPEWPDPYELTVTKVGRKWASTTGGGFREGPRVELATGLLETDLDGWGAHRQSDWVFTDPEGPARLRADWARRHELIEAINDHTVQRWRTWPTDLLEQLNDLTTQTKERTND